MIFIVEPSPRMRSVESRPKLIVGACAVPSHIKKSPSPFFVVKGRNCISSFKLTESLYCSKGIVES